VQGIAIGGAVIPIYFCLTWSKCSAVGAMTGAISGLGLGVMSWMVVCKAYYGEVGDLLWDLILFCLSPGVDADGHPTLVPGCT
jgi:hypothetical protein